MIFNFDKFLSKKETTPESPIESTELSIEQKQEKLENECIAEAEKLDISIAELKSDIDKFGGVEKFKEYFEANNNFEAYRTQHSLERDIDISKMNSNLNLVLFNVTAGLGVLFAKMTTGEDEIPMEVVYGMLSAITLTVSIAGYFKARKLKREKNINDLKFKMTGVGAQDR